MNKAFSQPITANSISLKRSKKYYKRSTQLKRRQLILYEHRDLSVKKVEILKRV